LVIVAGFGEGGFVLVRVASTKVVYEPGRELRTGVS
jgi:hypothetical protein